MILRISPEPSKWGLYGLILCLILTSAACKKKATDKIDKTIPVVVDETVHIITKHMDFEMPDTIKSGWNTFVYDNQSKETHFFVLEKYPEGKFLENTEAEIVPVFQAGMDLIYKGEPEKGVEEFAKLPKWFFEVVFNGGSGLLSPNKKAITTVHLEPGYYIVECYVKMPNGMFHTSMGMIKGLWVSEESTKLNQPMPTETITVSAETGFGSKDSLSSGKHVFEVNFSDQKVHENFVGHDVNLVRLEANADLDVLERWINWANPKGLISPAPSGFVFLGGVNDMPAGSKAYFEADLTPGSYLLISEVPETKQKNLLKTIKVY